MSQPPYRPQNQPGYPQQGFGNASYPNGPYQQGGMQSGHRQKPKSSNTIWWIFGGCSTLCVLVCCGGLGGLAMLGSAAPETSVYTGNDTPKKYYDVMTEVGALESDEMVLYFYSDALLDIKKGFYFVSDRKVVIYNEDSVTPLTAIPFEDIEDSQLDRDTSFAIDSMITLYLKSGQICSFPVSSEYDRDVEFHSIIEAQTTSDAASY